MNWELVDLTPPLGELCCSCPCLTFIFFIILIMSSQVQGPCEGHYPHWGYDADTKKCENFIYGGCLGNNNRSVKSVCNKSTCFKSVFLNQHLLISNFALEQIRQPRRV